MDFFDWMDCLHKFHQRMFQQLMQLWKKAITNRGINLSEIALLFLSLVETGTRKKENLAYVCGSNRY